MVYYEAWLRLKSAAGEPQPPFRTSDPFDADTPTDATAMAIEWMEQNLSAHDEADELWLHEGVAKTRIWSSEA